MARTAINTISTQIKNYLINGGFDFWQRNTSFSTPSNGNYTTDRWAVDYDGTIGTFTLSRQLFTLGQTDVTGEPQYFMRWDQTVAGSGSTTRAVRQRIEGVRNAAGNKVTVAFFAKADASRIVGVKLIQNFGTGGSPSSSVTIAQQNVTLGTTFSKFFLTFTIPSISGKTLGTNNNDYLEVRFELPLNVIMTIDLARIMMSDGEVPSNFKLAEEDAVAELQACQRYYEKSYDPAVTPGTPGAAEGAGFGQTLVGGANAPTGGQFFFKVQKRIIPTIVLYSPDTGASGVIRNLSTLADNAAIVTQPGTFSAVVTSSTSFPANNTVRWQWTADAEL